MDTYSYAMGMRRALATGEITRMIKESAIDRHLNAKQIQRAVNADLGEAKRHMVLSTGETVRNFQHGHRPFSGVCDYQPSCEYTTTDDNEEITNDDDDTYSTTRGIGALQRNRSAIFAHIRRAFRAEPAFTFKSLNSFIQKPHVFLHDEILDALSYMIENGERVVDKHGRQGVVVARKDMYLFQPLSAPNRFASVRERDEASVPRVDAVRIKPPPPPPLHLVSENDFWKALQSVHDWFKTGETDIIIPTWLNNARITPFCNHVGEILNLVRRNPGTLWKNYQELWTIENVSMYTMHHVFDVLDDYFRNKFILPIILTGAMPTMIGPEMEKTLSTYRESHMDTGPDGGKVPHFVVGTMCGQTKNCVYHPGPESPPVGVFNQQVEPGARLISISRSRELLPYMYTPVLPDTYLYIPSNTGSMNRAIKAAIIKDLFTKEGEEEPEVNVVKLSTKLVACIMELAARMKQKESSFHYIRPDQMESFPLTQAKN